VCEYRSWPGQLRDQLIEAADKNETQLRSLQQRGKLGSSAEKIAGWRDAEDRHRDITRLYHWLEFGPEALLLKANLAVVYLSASRRLSIPDSTALPDFLPACWWTAHDYIANYSSGPHIGPGKKRSLR